MKHFFAFKHTCRNFSANKLAESFYNFKVFIMAYVRLEKLETISNGTVASGGKLRDCTPSEDAEPASFYPEDIIRIAAQTGFASMQKQMATFWGETHQVWVGYDSMQNILTSVIATRCPPYYPPHTFPGVDISDMEKPEGFPS